MGLIEQVRSESFHWRDLRDSDTLDERFDDVEISDWTICFNDRKLNIYSRRYEDDSKMETVTRGFLYQILDKKINEKGDKVVKILNDKKQKIWILTDRFAFDPELAQNNMRSENLKKILDDEDVELI